MDSHCGFDCSKAVAFTLGESLPAKQSNKAILRKAISGAALEIVCVGLLLEHDIQWEPLLKLKIDAISPSTCATE